MSQSAQEALASANELYRSGQSQLAEQRLQQVLASEPGHRESLELLGKIHMRRRNFDAAATVHQRLVDDNPLDGSARNALAMSLFMQGRPDEALGELRQAVALRPQEPTFWANLGKVLMTQEDWAEAQTNLETALRLVDDPNKQQLLEMLNACLSNQEKPVRTAEFYRPQRRTSRVPAAPPIVKYTPPPQEPEEEIPAPVAAPAVEQPLPQAPRLEPSPRPLNLLFVQEAPCIRNYKMTSALRARGHRVSLAYTKADLSQMYKGLDNDTYDEVIQLRDNRHFWDLCGGYDLVHCHNEPDQLSVVALGGAAPVVHDTHDLISLRGGGESSLVFFEGLANRSAHGRVYTTAYQEREARDLYGVTGPSLVFNNCASAADLPRRRLPKLSAQDGKTHIVYEGGMGGSSHRDFIDLFADLGQAGLVVHMYPRSYDPELAQRLGANPNLRYHQPLSPRQIMEEMTQYDLGIIPFNLDKGVRRFLDSTLANKLFEYLAAGLPVVASDLQSYRDYFAQHPVGFTFSSASDIIQGLPRLRTIAQEVTLADHVRTYEGEITRLEEFYYQVIDQGARQGRAPAVVANQAETPSVAPEASPATSAAPTVASLPGATAVAALAPSLAQAIIDLQAWVEGNGWAGYDPYDVQGWILTQRRKGGLDPAKAQEILARERSQPAEIRRELGIAPQVNAKAMGLFLGSYALLGGLLPGQDFSRQIAECEDWLLNNAAPGLSGLGWGYPFDWESVVIIPAGTPTAVNSYHIGDAFWELWQATGADKWRERCLAVGDFLAGDLNQDRLDDQRLCFSYTPLDFYHVHNASLCVAEYLARLGLAADRPQWVERARQAVNFALTDLSQHGHLTYWARGFEPSPANVGQMDHYHTAAELRSLGRLGGLFPEWEELAQGYQVYLDYYLTNFFESLTVPKLHPQQTYPVDIHAPAEAAYILGQAAPSDETARRALANFIPWFLERCVNPDGSFIARLDLVEGREEAQRFPYLRWGQAWTLRGLTSALAASLSLGGKVR